MFTEPYASQIDDVESLIVRDLLAMLPAAVVPSASNLGLEELLFQVSTWQYRLVPQRPRRIHLARELPGDITDSVAGEHVDEVLQLIRSGGSLEPFLSTRAHKLPDFTKGKPQRPDHQLSAWGLHHLHVGPYTPGAAFAARSDEVLVVHFTREEAYVVALVRHGRWADRELALRVVGNWPGLGLFQSAGPDIDLAQDVTDEDIAMLTAYGVHVLFKMNGLVWSSQGQSVTGQPNAITEKMNALAHLFRRWRKHINESPERYEGWLADRESLTYGLRAPNGRFRPICVVAIGSYYFGENFKAVGMTMNGRTQWTAPR